MLSLLALLEEGFHFLEDFFVEKGGCQKYLIRVVLGKIKLLLRLKEKSKNPNRQQENAIYNKYFLAEKCHSSFNFS